MNGYTFQGSNSVIFIIASHVNWVSCKNFSLRADPFWHFKRETCYFRFAVTSCFPCIMADKYGVPIHPNSKFDADFCQLFVEDINVKPKFEKPCCLR